jgi:outer membrane protein assembly factor BamB
MTALGVVPVFFNAGVALLPAILAALASLAALVVRPGNLWRACKARPWTAVAAVACLAGLGGLTWWTMSVFGDTARRKPAPAARGETALAAAAHIDWAAVAVEWIRQDRLAAHGTPAPKPGPVPFVSPSPLAPAAVIFGHGPLRHGYAGGGSPLGLEPAWQFPSAGSKAAEDLEGALYLASPAVVGDAVFSAACLLDARRNYGTIFCLDAATGRPRWTVSDHKNAQGEECDFKGFFSSPAVSADGRWLVIGQGLHDDADCELICLDARTGRVHWLVPTPLHIEGSPAVQGDLVVAGAGAIEVGDEHRVKGHPGLVIGVRLSTGEKVWEYQLNDPESSPAVADGVVYIGSGFNGSAVAALRTEPDEELRRRGLARLVWRTPTPYPATGAVTLVDNLLLVGCGNGDYVYADPRPSGAVIALDRKTGGVRWRAPMPDAVLGRIAVLGSRAIAAVRNGEVVALDLAGPQPGKVLWRQAVHGGKAVLAGPAFTGTYVYAVSQDGWLAVLDARDGRPVERHMLNAPGKPGELGLSLSSPTVAGGRLYVGSETGGFRCFAGKEVRP